MKSTKNFFEVLPLFKHASVTQFLILLGELVKTFKEEGTLICNCFDCDIIAKVEKRTVFISESPKYELEDLQTIFEWFIANKVNGGIDRKFCKNTLDLISSLSINQETKEKFLEWVKETERA